MRYRVHATPGVASVADSVMVALEVTQAENAPDGRAVAAVTGGVRSATEN